jgi:tRNA(Ile)-lysidine synthase
VLAHHLSDLWETHWLKLLRFQVEGKAGMVPFSPPYFRPLLYVSKTMMDQEVHNRKLVYREDVSNQSDKYNRNFLRHQILPTIQERFGIEDNAIIQFNQRKADKESWNHYLMMNLLDQVITTDNHSATFDCNKIPHHLPLSTPLFHWLTPLGFSAEQIATIAEWDRIENGKKMGSSSHVLWKENHTFKVTPIDSDSLETHVINGPLFLDLFDWQGKVTQLPNPALYGDKKYLQIDLDKITFPCSLRPWRHGEKFQPFGMTGHVLVSDYLNQKKIPAALKSKIVVLESNNHLAAILGMEVANWCRIQPETKNVWLIHPFPAQS